MTGIIRDVWGLRLVLFQGTAVILRRMVQFSVLVDEIVEMPVIQVLLEGMTTNLKKILLLYSYFIICCMCVQYCYFLSFAVK